MIVEIIKKAIEGKSHEQALLEVSNLDFAERFRDACAANYCGRYGKSWSCPPALDSIENLKKKYQQYKYAFVFSTKTDLEDCFDIENMEVGRVQHTAITNEVIGQLKSNNIDFLPLGAGSCSLCAKCTYPDSPCRLPDKMYYSMEAVGIDVVELCSKNGMHYINGQNTVTYFSMFFFN